MSNKRDWTDALPDLLEGYTEQAPDGLWEAVRDAAAPRRRKTAAWWYAGGALAAAAAVSAVVLLTRPASPVPPAPRDSGEMLAEQAAPAAEEAVPAMAPPERQAPATAEPSPAALTAYRTGPVLSVQRSQPGPAAGESSASAPAREPAPQDGDPASAAASQPDSSQPDSSQPEAPTPAASRDAGQDAAQSGNPPSNPSAGPGEGPGQARGPLHRPGPRRNLPARTSSRVQFGVTTGLLAQATSGTRAGTPALLSQASASSLLAASACVAPPSRSMSSGGDVWTLLMAGRNKLGSTEVSHRQSARFGVGLKVSLLPRWGLETGLVRSQLQSTFQTPAGNASLTTERAYTYWGVPLYLHFDALQWRSLDLYLAGGPMLEWSRSCKESQSLYLDGKQLASKSGTPAFNDRRMSLNLDAGLQWTFFDHNALFIQPGFSWHFPSDGAPDNFYSAHPAAFQLTLGYRLLLF